MISAQRMHVFLDVVGLDDLDARRLGERLLHAVQSILQVGGAEARDQRDLALAVEQLDRLLAQDAAGREIVHAVERDALRRRRVGVPRRDRNAGVDRAIDRVGQELAVERRDGDAVDALRDVGLEDLLLLQLIRRRRRVPQHLDVAEFRRRALGADLRVVEDGNVERLRDDREAHLARRRVRRSRRRPGTADDAAAAPAPQPAANRSDTMRRRARFTISSSF